MLALVKCVKQAKNGDYTLCIVLGSSKGDCVCELEGRYERKEQGLEDKSREGKGAERRTNRYRR